VNALRGLLRKEILHIIRDRRTLTVLLALPIAQVIIFGYAIRTDVNDVRLAVVDPQPDHQTVALVERLEGTGVFHVVARVPRTSDLAPLFRTGQAQQGLVFEPGFASRLASGQPTRVLVVTDAAEPNTGSVMQSYTEMLVAGFQQSIAPPGPSVTIVPTARLRFNPTRESSNLFVPGLMAFVLTIVASLMTAISLTREKETGSMEALLASPLRPWQIVVGKVAPYLVIGFISVVSIVIETRVLFRVPLRGSLWLLLAEGGLYILVSLALGILISARTASQRVAMTAALLITMLPNILISGFVFPVESMPLPLQVFSTIVPGRWFIAIVRGIMLKGVGLDHLWRQTAMLGAIALVLLTASVRSFHERLE
jgi:ABC-2 type transport system permease protein